MESMLTFTGIIIIVFGILQIILFFKLWRMTNDVRKIKVGLLREDPLGEATILFLKGEKEAAYKQLFESFLRNIINAANSTWTSNPNNDYKVDFKNIKQKYFSAFEKIGLGHPDYTLYDELEKVKL